jgi:hypothetical protein
MDCIICGGETGYYFSKDYADTPFGPWMAAIGPIAYHRCRRCGFVLSKTHAELSAAAWGELNAKFHAFTSDPDQPNESNQAPYAEQAVMLATLGRHGVIDTGGMLDFAGGMGTLSHLLKTYFGMRLPIYDPYVEGDADTYLRDAPAPGSYRTVINSAMFEHVLRREDLDAVNAVVAANGALIIHTVVCERVPPDPNWFYLVPPVHTAFHTNASMQVLMDQWGYRSSIYSPKSKCWALLRKDVAEVEPAVAAINEELQNPWLICKQGFVDYWKGF